MTDDTATPDFDPATLGDMMPFSKLMGVKVTSADATGVTAELVITPELCTTGNIMHGGAMMAFADSLGAIAAVMSLPEGAGGTTTIESKTNFLRGAPEGSTVTGETRPIKLGRRLSVWQTTLRGADGKDVALITQTQLVL